MTGSDRGPISGNQIPIGLSNGRGIAQIDHVWCSTQREELTRHAALPSSSRKGRMGVGGTGIASSKLPFDQKLLIRKQFQIRMSLFRRGVVRTTPASPFSSAKRPHRILILSRCANSE